MKQIKTIILEEQDILNAIEEYLTKNNISHSRIKLKCIHKCIGITGNQIDGYDEIYADPEYLAEVN